LYKEAVNSKFSGNLFAQTAGKMSNGYRTSAHQSAIALCGRTLLFALQPLHKSR
jgi:hypothetical protein